MWEVWQYRLDRDNPWISPQIKRRIIAQQKAAGEVYYRRNILGEWVAAEGRIWNLVEGPMPTAEESSGRWLEIGVDEGHESPSAAVAILPCADRLVVVGEYWHDPKAAGQHPLHGGEQATRMMAWARALPWPIGSVWVDPSVPRACGRGSTGKASPPAPRTTPCCRGLTPWPSSPASAGCRWRMLPGWWTSRMGMCGTSPPVRVWSVR